MQVIKLGAYSQLALDGIFFHVIGGYISSDYAVDLTTTRRVNRDGITQIHPQKPDASIVI